MTDGPNWLPIAKAVAATVAQRGLANMPQSHRDALSEMVEDEIRQAENLQLVTEGADVGHLVQGLDEAVEHARRLVEQLRGWSEEDGKPE